MFTDVHGHPKGRIYSTVPLTRGSSAARIRATRAEPPRGARPLPKATTPRTRVKGLSRHKARREEPGFTLPAMDAFGWWYDRPYTQYEDDTIYNYAPMEI